MPQKRVPGSSHTWGESYRDLQEAMAGTRRSTPAEPEVEAPRRPVPPMSPSAQRMMSRKPYQEPRRRMKPMEKIPPRVFEELKEIEPIKPRRFTRAPRMTNQY